MQTVMVKFKVATGKPPLTATSLQWPLSFVQGGRCGSNISNKRQCFIGISKHLEESELTMHSRVFLLKFEVFE